ncbi:DMT family transporter [Carboxydothermus hydrogenoformans]|uniref:Putative membrane protein n=1 Tax=Carboxydothermus hydrogenoformans (strain ATCC BAA-161 / DSM 6008 / Z-2901) TaxID=246194 RepID=Q3AFW1_CARHZ|nr:DMT family transporter [Carboxydothermus hydrogenoformans]ABB14723.1 putative membrane protein [Carboxydothermus hydrogenoformans Z-2901]
MSQYYRGVLLTFLSAAGFGLLPIFAVFAYKEGASPYTLLFWRFFLAGLIFQVYNYYVHKGFGITKKEILYVLAMGILYTIQSSCFFLSVKYISASLTSLIFYTYPALVAILSSIVYKDRLGFKGFVAVALAFAGLILVLGNISGKLNPTGVLFALATALVYSVYITLGKKVLTQIPSLTASSFIAVFAAMCFLVVGLLSGTLDFLPPEKVWFSISGIVVFSTLLAMFTFFRGIELLGPARASIISMFEPVVTVIFAALLFAEKLTPGQIAGGALVLLGAYLVAKVEN